MFPYDMLRYDQCWPVTSEDAFKVVSDVDRRSIKMRSYRAPTIEHWSSFGWACGTEVL